MKKLVSIVFGIFLSFSSFVALANSSGFELNEIKEACHNKQALNSCSVESNDSSYMGKCVDAKRYELLCISEDS